MVWVMMIILAVVQGLTEFLPISSSGHLVLLYQWFGIENQTILLSIILHVATLLSVLIVYRKTVWTLIKHPFCHTNFCLLFATIPTVIFVLLFRNMIDYSFGGTFLWLGFLITAFLLSIAHILSRKRTQLSYSITKMPIGFLDAVIMGMGQGIACFPAISRSGTTIACGLILGVDKKVATDFSFLMSIPIIIGSLFYELIKNKFQVYLSYSWTQLLVGFIICFIVGLFAIKALNLIVKKDKLSLFAKYLFALSIILLIIQLYQTFFV